jgi:hypothetical protein
LRRDEDRDKQVSGLLLSASGAFVSVNRSPIDSALGTFAPSGKTPELS